MKILKLFSMVLALHLVLLVVFLVSPGCQSQPSSAVDSSAPHTSENWSNQGASDSQAGGATSTLDPLPSGGSSAYSSQPLLGQTPADRARSQPTRPSAGGVLAATPSVDAREEVLRPIDQAPAEERPVEPTLIIYSVQRGDSLWSISRQFGVTVRDIVESNPGINPDSIQYGQKVKVPDLHSGAISRGAGVPEPASQVLPSGAETYTVRAGDFLARIASRHGTTVGAIRRANGLTSDLIQVGQVLVIPSDAGRTTGASSIPADAVTVTVQPGDTMGEIARKYDVTISELMEVNSIEDPRRIRVGQRLVIPGFKSVDSSRTDVTVTPVPTAIPTPAPAIVTSPTDLDRLIPGDDLPTPVIPIDEPVPAP